MGMSPVLLSSCPRARLAPSVLAGAEPQLSGWLPSRAHSGPRALGFSPRCAPTQAPVPGWKRDRDGVARWMGSLSGRVGGCPRG